MNDFMVFIYLIFFVALCGATFAYTFKSMTAVFEEMDKPIRRTRNVHPEMADVQTGEELLVFKATEEEDDDDDEGDVVVIRK